MKKKEIDPILGYKFNTNADSILWDAGLGRFGGDWEEKKVTGEQIIKLLRKLTLAIQQDLTDIAEGTITIPHDGEVTK